MYKAPGTTRFFGLLRVRRPPAFGDAADMGTAIGLDYSLDQPPEDVAPKPASKGKRWVQRLTSRARPSA